MDPIRWMWTGLVASSLAIGAIGAPQEAEIAEPSAQEAPKGGFSLRPDEDGEIELTAVLRAFTDVTGWVVSMSDETASLIERMSFYSSGPIETSAEDSVRVVSSLLSSMGYLWTVMRAEEPRILAIRSLDTTARGTARQDARFVPAEELPGYADHTALLIQTILSMPNTDVRTLSNSMRAMVVDPNLLQIVPLGASSELLIQGFGSAVHDLAIMLREVERVSTPPGTPTTAPETRPVPIHSAQGERVIQAGGEQGESLLDLVTEFARATGQVAIIDQENLSLLARNRVRLSAPLRVSGDDFSTVCEELLMDQNFVVTDLSHGSPCLFTVRSMNTTARGTARASARYVDEESLADCRRRPATMFETVIALPGIDVRTLSNSMRVMVVDPNTLQIIPVGNTSSMIILGRGRQLADLVEMFRRLPANSNSTSRVMKNDEDEDEQERL